MENLAKALAERGTAKQPEEFIDLYTDLLTATFDQATAYLNAVSIGGYAAYFALWSLVGDNC